jgi:hypothetical protein
VQLRAVRYRIADASYSPRGKVREGLIGVLVYNKCSIWVYILIHTNIHTHIHTNTPRGKTVDYNQLAADLVDYQVCIICHYVSL